MTCGAYCIGDAWCVDGTSMDTGHGAILVLRSYARPDRSNRVSRIVVELGCAKSTGLSRTHACYDLFRVRTAQVTECNVTNA